MSSEMYIHWEVRNRERLHKQLKIQLEKERQHQENLFRQMMVETESITNKIGKVKGDVIGGGTLPVLKSTRMRNISNYKTDELVSSGVSENIEDTKIQSVFVDKKERVAGEWSNLFENFEEQISNKGKKMAYAEGISKQLAMAVLESDSEIRSRNSFVSYLNDLIDDNELDFECFKLLIDGRFAVLKKSLSLLAPEDITEDLFEYYALCKLLGMKPKRIRGKELREENEVLFGQYAEKKREDYVYQNLKEVFSELGMDVVDEMQLDGVQGRKIVDVSLPDYAIFMGMNGDGIVFETVVEVENSNTLSLNKKTKIEEGAYKICQKHMQVIRKMKERGIDLKIEYQKEPKAEKIQKIKKKSLYKTMHRRKQEKYIGG